MKLNIYEIPLNNEDFKNILLKYKIYLEQFKNTTPEYIISTIVYLINDINLKNDIYQYKIDLKDKYINIIKILI